MKRSAEKTAISHDVQAHQSNEDIRQWIEQLLEDGVVNERAVLGAAQHILALFHHVIRLRTSVKCTFSSVLDCSRIHTVSPKPPDATQWQAVPIVAYPT